MYLWSDQNTLRQQLWELLMVQASLWGYGH